MIQKSLVLLKPDAVQRGIIGEIVHRFERAGLKIVGVKLAQVDEAFGAKHYKHTEDWKMKVGARNIEECARSGLSTWDCFGTDQPKEIAEVVDKRNAMFLSMGPVLAIVFEGPNAVAKIRSLVGPTFPDSAPPGTIRGDYGLDSSYSAMLRKRTTYNMIHASGSLEEAEEEVNLWFKSEEILTYRRVHEDLYNY
ncbi:MAG: Nucleoside diphosphate kinase [candidate division WWE3 bacterium GW2011_GWB1_44_4]|uniref:nucleoside-diphosphate kinase n=1 Tax=candidate division WWE3 bacterium GW2011_GWB1_44_4 TaxID=1619116 RepID=A0A0G1JCI5_UNCKA|nr:MAG: Nucleoside diphosphate kinase [candidate division WWE3 bacterium GW2011_GWB1_44_4]